MASTKPPAKPTSSPKSLNGVAGQASPSNGLSNSFTGCGQASPSNGLSNSSTGCGQASPSNGFSNSFTGWGQDTPTQSLGPIHITTDQVQQDLDILKQGQGTSNAGTEASASKEKDDKGEEEDLGDFPAKGAEGEEGLG
jgi:hypothetical protein